MGEGGEKRVRCEASWVGRTVGHANRTRVVVGVGQVVNRSVSVRPEFSSFQCDERSPNTCSLLTG